MVERHPSSRRIGNSRNNPVIAATPPRLYLSPPMLRLFRDALTRFRLLSTRGLARVGLGEETFLAILAFAIGVITAAAAVGFHELIEQVRYFCYVRLQKDFRLYGRDLWMIAMLPAAGGLIVGIITRYVYHGRGGGSMIDVMESVGRASGGVKARSAAG